MSRYQVYLSGASKNVEDEGSRWRRDLEKFVLDKFPSSIDLFIPNDHYDYTFRQPETTKECRKLFMNHLKNSDVIIVNLDNTNVSVGTGFEIGVAEEFGIPIIGFCSNPESAYPWIVDCCDVIKSNMMEAFNYALLHYMYYAR